jgi:hypothetical protein
LTNDLKNLSFLSFLEANISIKFDRVSLRAISKCSLIIESEESRVCLILDKKTNVHLQRLTKEQQER